MPANKWACGPDTTPGAHLRHAPTGRRPATSRLLLAAFILFLFAGLFLSACYPVTRPVVKLGLVAPFEGRYREIGYEVIYAVRLAVREANAAGGVAGYMVELTALDDSGAPDMAVQQARKLAADPQIVGALGHWLEATTLAAAPEYAAAGLPLLATSAAPELDPAAFRLWPSAATQAGLLPEAHHCPAPCASVEDLRWLTQTVHADPAIPIIGPPLWQTQQFLRLAGANAEGVYFIAPAPFPADSTDPGFAERYQAGANGTVPGAYATLAYDATRLWLDAIARDIQAHATPSRAGAAAALEQTKYAGLSGHFSFDTQRQWAEATGWVYQWQAGQPVRP